MPEAQLGWCESRGAAPGLGMRGQARLLWPYESRTEELRNLGLGNTPPTGL